MLTILLPTFAGMVVVLYWALRMHRELRVRRAREGELLRSTAAAVQSRRRMVDVTDKLPGAIYEFVVSAGGDLRLTFASDVARTIFGFTPRR